MIPDKILITEKCLQKNHDELGNLFQPCDMITISDSVAQKLSGVKTSQGVFAIVKTLDKNLDADTIIKNGGNYIGLCSIQDPGNMGTMIRTADAFGIDGVILYDTCDIYSPKVVRSTMGSLFRTKLMQCSDMLALVQKINNMLGATFAAVVDESAQSLEQLTHAACTLLLVGNEANGLPQELVQACNHTVTIPMKGNAESLNAAVAASICMWEMTRRGYN